ncbi:uncharacterized protein MONOS_18330 [Monocercomonoides exilis]|uniref:uncharacterized protein n=1 Tax=Monocercomonoides exilis TaxID=2049356 RepID=UPI0035597FD0|nr:hypothetical protein MONOS_18330 [Monocercomonoides exilis]
MDVFAGCTMSVKMWELTVSEKFNKLFSELEYCKKAKQIQKIKEMNRLIEEMNSETLDSVFTTDLFNEISRMIEEKKLNWNNAFLLLKCIGNCSLLNNCYDFEFLHSSLLERFEELIFEEYKKIEEKNKMVFVNICECYLLFYNEVPHQLLSTCVSCLLIIALNKEETEEVQKKVEMALLTLSCIIEDFNIEKRLYFPDIKEIIEYHQKFHNLTQIAYQSAWEFLIKRRRNEDSLEEVIVNELHFAREATKEVEELAKCANWKRKGKMKMGKEGIVISRWLKTLGKFLDLCKSWDDECDELIHCLVSRFREANDNYGEINNVNMYFFIQAVRRRDKAIDAFLKNGAIEAVLEKVVQLNAKLRIVDNSLRMLKILLFGLKSEMEKENDEVKRKEKKRVVREKMEEEGFEDCVYGYLHCWIKDKYFSYSFVLNVEDYFFNL